MTYHHLTIDELTMIANFHDQGVKAYRAAKLLKRSLETIRTIPLEVDTFKNESVAFGGIFVCQRIQRSKNFNY